MKNALSIDLEDWFCVHNLAQAISRDDWDKCDLRVRNNTMRILDLLDQRKVKATFFILGWVAERAPDLIREVEARGHEIGVHGYNHLLLTEITPEEFDADLDKALEAIAKAGVKSTPLGFRAPSFSMVNSTKDWALPTLEKYGFRYDSSVFPVGFHPDYGIADAPLVPYKITDKLYEFPMSVLELYGRRFPFCGGGYFRLFPYSYTRFCMRKVNQQGRSAVFYLHPWELDPGQPRIKNLSATQKFRHYRNLDQTERRLSRLLDDFEFTTVREVLQL
ncbi:MAG TPA: XrtA system polysaccharide deacetylase [Pyrinomonadaceae bacterium]|jgi:polysaccharide deacetylase family protein (PEP-CTERM system associated)|nr:XrtA system polysaccharide deacetylase [Pyrinomonadaceae bacterium]